MIARYDVGIRKSVNREQVATGPALVPSLPEAMVKKEEKAEPFEDAQL
jgi:hypothetical protein